MRFLECATPFKPRIRGEVSTTTAEQDLHSFKPRIRGEVDQCLIQS